MSSPEEAAMHSLGDASRYVIIEQCSVADLGMGDSFIRCRLAQSNPLHPVTFEQFAQYVGTTELLPNGCMRRTGVAGAYIQLCAYMDGDFGYERFSP